MSPSGATAETIEQEERVEISADAIDAGFIPTPRSKVAGVELDGEAVLLLEGTGDSHWLDQLGTIVWNCFDGIVTVEDLSLELSEAFGADLERVQEDVLELTRKLGRVGLLEGVARDEHHGHQHGATRGLELGTEIPDFHLSDVHGCQVGLEDLRGQELLLVNWSPHCGFCSRIAPDLAEMLPQLDRRNVQLVLLAIGDAQANQELLDEFGIESKVLLHNGTDAEVFAGLGTPSAYFVDAEGKVASEIAIGANDVPRLVRVAAGLDGGK